MTDLLCGLEIALDFPIDISANLRTHVTRIDDYLHDPLSQTLALPLEHQQELQSDLTAWQSDLDDDFSWLLATNYNSPNYDV